MLTNEQKKQMISMALTCLRRPGEDRPIFSPTLPSEQELEQIKKGLKDGDISEELLSKLFPMAYKGIVKDKDIFYFYLITHNQMISKLERYTKDDLITWCKVYPATVIKVNEVEGKFFVRSCDNSKELWTDSECYPGIRVVDESQLNVGKHIMVHRDKIHWILDEEKYKEAVELYKESLKT